MSLAENDFFDAVFTVTTDGTAVPEILLTSVDAALFDFVETEARSGFASYRLTPKTAFDFENPTDQNADSRYEVSYSAAGAVTLEGTFDLTVTNVPSDGVVVFRHELDGLERLEDVAVLGEDRLLGLSIYKRGTSNTRL
jgi:hypothetical protein